MEPLPTAGVPQSTNGARTQIITAVVLTLATCCVGIAMLYRKNLPAGQAQLVVAPALVLAAENSEMGTEITAAGSTGTSGSTDVGTRNTAVVVNATYDSSVGTVAAVVAMVAAAGDSLGGSENQQQTIYAVPVEDRAHTSEQGQESSHVPLTANVLYQGGGGGSNALCSVPMDESLAGADSRFGADGDNDIVLSARGLTRSGSTMSAASYHGTGYYDAKEAAASNSSTGSNATTPANVTVYAIPIEGEDAADNVIAVQGSTEVVEHDYTSYELPVAGGMRGRTASFC